MEEMNNDQINADILLRLTGVPSQKGSGPNPCQPVQSTSQSCGVECSVEGSTEQSSPAPRRGAPFLRLVS